MAETVLTMADLGISAAADPETNIDEVNDEETDELDGGEAEATDEEKEPEAKEEPAKEEPAKEPEKPEEKKAEPAPYEVPSELKEVFPEAKSEAEVIAGTKALKGKVETLNGQITDFVNLLNEFPVVGEVLKDLKSGKESPAKVFRKHLELADDELPPDAVEDPAGYKAFEEKRLKREIQIKALNAEKEAEEKRQKDEEAKKQAELLAMESKAIEHKKAYMTRTGKSAAEVDDMLVKFNKVMGTLDDKTLDRIAMMVNYEADMEAEKKRGEEAAQKAKVEGKNAAIDELKQKTKGNGLPAMHSGSAVQKETRRDQIFKSLKPGASIYDTLT